MAHKHHNDIRYIQHQLEKETGVKVSYNWVLQEFDKRFQEAQRFVTEKKTLRDVLVELIRPARRN